MTEDSKFQASISYIGDLAYTPPESVLLVEKDGDYVQACKELSRLGNSDGRQKVWVRSRNHFAWLRDFIGQIGCPSSFKEMTARLVLAEQWKVRVPDWLSDADILEENLLEYVLPPEQILFVRKVPAEAVYDLPLEPSAREQILT